MRIAATLALFILAALNAASFSSLHIDHPGSHLSECAPGKAGADCHSEQPHQHEATHGGEESLFEHIFEQSRAEKSTALYALVLISSPLTLVTLPAPHFFREPLRSEITLLTSSLIPRAGIPRAPPLFVT